MIMQVWLKHAGEFPLLPDAPGTVNLVIPTTKQIRGKNG